MQTSFLWLKYEDPNLKKGNQGSCFILGQLTYRRFVSWRLLKTGNVLEFYLGKKTTNVVLLFFFPFDVLKGVLPCFWTTKKSSNLYMLIVIRFKVFHN
jgi:hypothetical protein